MCIVKNNVVSSIIREAFINKKKVTFVTLGSDNRSHPPYFPESVKKNQKKWLLKCNIKPF